MSRLGRRAFMAAVAMVASVFRPTTYAQSFSLEQFLALSARLTGSTDLDRDTASILLKHLLATPGNDARLALHDAAMEREIIVAWYTGVLQVRGEPQRITHTGALQWRVMGVLAPGVCVGPFGAWARPHQLREP